MFEYFVLGGFELDLEVFLAGRMKNIMYLPMRVGIGKTIHWNKNWTSNYSIFFNRSIANSISIRLN